MKKEEQSLPNEPASVAEQWDQFYAKNNCDFYSESYADWPQLQATITTHLSSLPPPASILVPACGTSRLSEHLYDAGFNNITNVDFSKVLITHMLKRNVRERPLMKWRVADMMKMDKFADDTFDAVIDKGAWDSLLSPNHAPVVVMPYLFEVKSLLKTGGIYICITFGESSWALYSKFRFGWKVTVYAIDLEQSEKPRQQAFMVVAEKQDSTVVSQITSHVQGLYSPESRGNDNKARREFLGQLEKELQIREEYSKNNSEVFVPYEDLVLVAKVNFSEFLPGRRLQLTMGEFGLSRFFYDCVLIDARIEAGPFKHLFYVNIIQKSSSLQWLLQESESQWLTVKSFSASRLLMIILDSSHADVSKNEKDVLSDITPLIKQLAPDCGVDTSKIQLVFTSDGIKNQEILHQVTSSLSGLISVDDVSYEEGRFPAMYLSRCLRIHTHFISEVLYTIDRSIGVSTTSKSKKKKRKQGKPHNEAIRFHHTYLLSEHHNAIISGLLLIYVHLETSLEGLLKSLVIDSAPPSEVKTVIIGLRAGVLAMFMNSCLPYLTIEVVENDPLILDISKQYFGFREDERLKVHIGDGIDYMTEKAKAIICSDGEGCSKIDILIVDGEVPHSKSNRGFTSPDMQFIDESFILSVKKSLSNKGLFVVNIITWSSSARDSIYSVLKSVFPKVFHLPIVPGVNEVVFALNSESPVNLSEACNEVERCLRKRVGEWCKRVIDASKLVKTLE